MIGIASVSALDCYYEHVKRLHAMFGSDLWLLLYQTDMRMRMEQWERIRRRGATERNTLESLGAVHGFNPDRPWDWVIRESVSETAFSFWYGEFESKAILIKAHADRLQHHLGPEVSSLNSALPPGSSGRQHVPPPPPPTGQRPAKRSKIAPQDRSHNLDAQGKYMTTRRGVVICTGYNEGTCTETDMASGGARCRKHPNLAHQCNLCLGWHPANSPGVCPGMTSSTSGAGKGKGKQGKGKGKKKGKW